VSSYRVAVYRVDQTQSGPAHESASRQWRDQQPDIGPPRGSSSVGSGEKIPFAHGWAMARDGRL
jgi:hypothetical protein